MKAKKASKAGCIRILARGPRSKRGGEKYRILGVVNAGSKWFIHKVALGFDSRVVRQTYRYLTVLKPYPQMAGGVCLCACLCASLRFLKSNTLSNSQSVLLKSHEDKHAAVVSWLRKSENFISLIRGVPWGLLFRPNHSSWPTWPTATERNKKVYHHQPSFWTIIVNHKH